MTATLTVKEKTAALLFSAAAGEALRLAVFSRPLDTGVTKETVRLCRHKGALVAAFEKQAKDGKVYHENLSVDALEEAVLSRLALYRQLDIMTPLGDASYKQSAKGKEVLLGGDALLRKLEKEKGNFADAVNDTLNNRKNYVLRGDEPFLHALGVTDAHGRVHDKKQAKFRQINRFLEHIRDIEHCLPSTGKLLIYDLCCGKSYLSFAAYHYFHVIREREVEMLGMDLKADCMAFCADLAEQMGFDGMTFRTGDIRALKEEGRAPDLVLSLHACDIATDIVLRLAADVRAKVILSTPCCQHDLLTRVKAPDLSFVTDHPKLSGKLCEALTDALRLSRLRTLGYETAALELTDPENTPKNTLLRAVLDVRFDPNGKKAQAAKEEYAAALRFVLGDGVSDYPERCFEVLK